MAQDADAGTKPAASLVAPGNGSPQVSGNGLENGGGEEGDLSGTSKALLEALAKFVKEAAHPAPEEESLRAWQYAGLTLFVSAVSLFYIVANAFVPALVKAEVWHLVTQFVTLAVGGGFLAVRSKALQKWLLQHAGTARFISVNMLLILVLGAAASTRLPEFEVPVQVDSSIDSYCIQPVKHVDDVMIAAKTVPATADLLHGCDAGIAEPGGVSYLRGLKLGQDYMVTVRFHGNGVERYYLGKGSVWSAFFGGKVEPLQFALAIVKFKLNSAKPGKASIKIDSHVPSTLVYVSASTPECLLDVKNPGSTTCALLPEKNTILELMPGDYSLTATGCKVQPKLSRKDFPSTVEDTPPLLGCEGS